MVRYRVDRSTQEMIERAEAEGIDLEERSFENLIWFFRVELMKVQKGEPHGLFPRDRKRLFQNDILKNSYSISEKALEVLLRIMEEEKG